MISSKLLHALGLTFIFILYIVSITLPGLYYESITFDANLRYNTTPTNTVVNTTIGLDLSLTAYHFTGVYTTARVVEHNTKVTNLNNDDFPDTSIAASLFPFLEKNWEALVHFAVDERTDIRDCLVYEDITVAALVAEIISLVRIFTPSDYGEIEKGVIFNTTDNMKIKLTKNKALLNIIQPTGQCTILCLGSKVVAGIGIGLFTLVLLMALINLFTDANFHERWYLSRLAIMLTILLCGLLFIAFSETQFARCNPYQNIGHMSTILKQLTTESMSDACTTAGFEPENCIEVGNDRIPYLDLIVNDKCSDDGKTCSAMSNVYSKDRGAALYIFFVTYLLCFGYTIYLPYESTNGPTLTYFNLKRETELKSFF